MSASRRTSRPVSTSSPKARSWKAKALAIGIVLLFFGTAAIALVTGGGQG
ncbi:MAG TPA: hypothetical protein VM681_10165 [Candidatus Thermoplasmatota archaeon]|nr:hypothetical protein [Candidatus Thermoplasmatota archaeon]